MKRARTIFSVILPTQEGRDREGSEGFLGGFLTGFQDGNYVGSFLLLKKDLHSPYFVYMGEKSGQGCARKTAEMGINDVIGAWNGVLLTVGKGCSKHGLAEVSINT